MRFILAGRRRQWQVPFGMKLSLETSGINPWLILVYIHCIGVFYSLCSGFTDRTCALLHSGSVRVGTDF